MDGSGLRQMYYFLDRLLRAKRAYHSQGLCMTLATSYSGRPRAPFLAWGSFDYDDRTQVC